MPAERPQVTGDSGTDVDPLDALPCGFVAFLDDGTIVRANRPFAELLDYPRESIVGRHVETLLPPGSRLFYQTHLFPLLRLSGRAEEIFMLFRPRTGDDVGALINGQRVERDGRWTSECALFPVRERRKFEDALLRAKQAAETAQAEVAQRNAELSDANARLTEQATELELQQQQLQEQAVEMEVQQEELQRTNDILIDRTEALERERAAAQAANKAKGDFLAVMSHELRTPLNAIGGYAELMELGVHGPVTAEQRADLARIRTSQRHLLGLINSVLNYAKVEANAVHYQIAPAPMAEILATCEALTATQARARALKLEVEPCDADVRVLADREKVQQILINLLTNATKFTDPGGSITMRCTSDEKHVVTEVRDTGHGIAADQLERIFEPFVQVDSGLTRSHEGVGLGLAISRDLARGMNGELTATSEVGKGSTFRLVLPRAI